MNEFYFRSVASVVATLYKNMNFLETYPMYFAP